MDPIKNPFSPGAGSQPPELVGRKEILDQAHILLGRISQGRPERSILLTGLRGVGKTVLLNAISKLADGQNFRIVSIEAHEDKALPALLAPPLRTILLELDRISHLGNKAKRGLSVLKSFLNGVKLTIGDIGIELNVDPEVGSADSGDLESDLPNLFLAVAEAASERNLVIGIFIDEVQYLNQKELSALIMAMHKMQQRQLPLLLVGAGLPILPGLAGESKSYAERLFSFPNIGPLSKDDAFKALEDPVSLFNVHFTQESLEEIYRLTKGYPYFLQEWGYHSWNLAESSPFTIDLIQRASLEATKNLDKSFFRVRFDRLTPGEKRCLYAMATLGSGLHRSADVCDALGIKLSSLGPVRANLIQKGMIYSPAYGEMEFTVPLFDEFMLRAMPNFTKSS